MLVTDRIETNPKVMMGKPVVRGTRIAVELILRKISEGATEQELLDAYPRLTREASSAALALKQVGTQRKYSPAKGDYEG
jgi:uncharacterized protein (DUF433 family)